ncbi:MAG TPA: Calx-beta domain-containing protein [Thermoanaerobaculia bacterium]|nr:Calx-beta domain-containing protein [Thermoanaerobaculia bacterium]
MAIFNVDNLTDAGPGSLRQAIADANTAPGADVVTFQTGLTGTIALTSGQIDVHDSVDIQGPGAAVLTVSGSNASRVFYLYNSAALLDVTISGLTVTGGNATIGGGIVDWGETLLLHDMVLTGNNASDQGGALEVLAGFNSPLLPFDVTIRDCVLSGNTAVNGGAVALYLDNGVAFGTVLVEGSTITGNDASCDGGGILIPWHRGDVTIQTSTISGNDAGAGGGGIWQGFFYLGSTLTVRETTISGNTADHGGGLGVYYEYGTLLVENSTVSANQATGGAGGGVYVGYFYGGDDVTLRHATIAGNSAVQGGGVFAQVGQPLLDHTIVADNTAGSNPDLANGDASFDLRYSLVETPGTANVNDLVGNLFSQDPQLGPLQGNGGPTATLRQAVTSPVVDAGEPATLATDQRGVPRPGGVAVDIGAVELSPGFLQLSASAYSVNENAGTVTVTVTRTGGTDGAVAVSYATSDGTATDPADFADAAGTLNWADGDAAPKTFQVTIVDDLLDEPDETFGVALSNPQVAVLGAPTTATVTILDNDPPAVLNPGVLQLSASAYSVNENAGTVTITVTRTGGSDGAVSVSYATSDDTAGSPADFTAAGGMLNWADGDTAPKTFQVTIADDLLDEPDETFGVTLSNPQAATLGTPAAATVTILDDDLRQSAVEIPTLGGLGEALLAGLVGLAGFLRLRRRKGLP